MSSKPKFKPVQTPLSDVRGKVAFITGGSSGIGLGLGKVLSAAGMKVVFTYLNEKHRDSALAQFPKGNPGVHAIRLNTTDREGMVRAADEAERVFGNVHLLVNNAGVGLPALLSKVSWEDWDWAHGRERQWRVQRRAHFPAAHAEARRRRPHHGHFLGGRPGRRHAGCLCDHQVRSGGHVRSAAHGVGGNEHRRIDLLPGPGAHADLRRRAQPAGIAWQEGRAARTATAGPRRTARWT